MTVFLVRQRCGGAYFEEVLHSIHATRDSAEQEAKRRDVEYFEGRNPDQAWAHYVEVWAVTGMTERQTTGTSNG